MLEKIKSDVIQLLIPRVKAKLKPELQALFNDAIILWTLTESFPFVKLSNLLLSFKTSSVLPIN